MRRIPRLLLVLSAAAPALAWSTPAHAAVLLDGSFTSAVVKPSYAGSCPDGTECGTIELDGFGTADWTYTYGAAFEPDGRCFDVDGTMVVELQSDGSTISGPLTGTFCPRPAGPAHEHAGQISYGNPYLEDDTVALGSGTGQFDGLSGIAAFHTSSAGARFTGTLTGTLS